MNPSPEGVSLSCSRSRLDASSRLIRAASCAAGGRRVGEAGQSGAARRARAAGCGQARARSRAARRPRRVPRRRRPRRAGPSCGGGYGGPSSSARGPLARRHPRSSAVRRCHAVHCRSGEEVCRAGISGATSLSRVGTAGRSRRAQRVGPRHGRSRIYRRYAYGATARVDPSSTPEAAFVTVIFTHVAERAPGILPAAERPGG